MKELGKKVKAKENNKKNKKKNKKSRGNENVFVKIFKKAAVHSLNSEQQRKFWKEQA